MKLYSIDEISIREDRIRKFFDPARLEELSDSIISHGLFHPLLVRESAEGPELIAGERRLRCLTSLYEFGIQVRFDGKILPLDKIPTVTRGEVDPAVAREAELEENIARQDITWQERESAVAELHLTLQQNYKNQSYKDTAQMLKGDILVNANDQTRISKAIIINRHLSDPDVQKAANPTEALKIIEKKETKKLMEARALQIGSQSQTERHKVFQGDAREILLSEEINKEFDCILTDPPYGIKADSFGDMAEGDHDYDDDPDYVFEELLPKVFFACWLKTKPQAHLYAFCDPRYFNRIQLILAEAGWSPWPVPIIWSKLNGMLPRPEHGPRRCYETIVYALKGDKKTTGVYSDVIELSPVQSRRHAAQKPVSLYNNLLARSCRPGDRVLDPFCGSGTIFAAANSLALYATGIEKDSAQFAISQSRLLARGD